MKKLITITNGRSYDASTTLEEWADAGLDLQKRAEQTTWEFAEWAAFGDTAEGEKRAMPFGKLKEYCDAHGINYQTARNCGGVARAFELSRRRYKLSFSHHAELVPLPQKDQDRWLHKAEQEGLSVAEMRRQVRAQVANGASTRSDGPVFRFAEKTPIELLHFFKTRPDEYWSDDTRNHWRPVLEILQSKLS